MPIYKIQIEENGKIFGFQGIEAVNDAQWIDGIEVEEHFYQEVAVDLWAAINIYYFDFQTETFIARPVNTATPNKLTIAADGTDTFILSGLPISCTVTVDDAAYEVNDGEFGFPTTLPGTYIVKASAFPYVEKTWEVIAV